MQCQDIFQVDGIEENGTNLRSEYRGIRGGQVIGANDEKGAYVADRMVTMGDLFATIYKALGIDWTKEYMTPIGRSVKIANSIEDKAGQPITELI